MRCEIRSGSAQLGLHQHLPVAMELRRARVVEQRGSRQRAQTCAHTAQPLVHDDPRAAAHTLPPPPAMAPTLPQPTRWRLGSTETLVAVRGKHGRKDMAGRLNRCDLLNRQS